MVVILVVLVLKVILVKVVEESGNGDLYFIQVEKEVQVVQR